MRHQFHLSLALALGLTGCVARAAGDAGSYFVIRVVDEQTGRGVPLVELKTVNSAAWWTDSNGLIAFHEPGLMGQEVFFHVSSPGYEYPKDFFDQRGVKLRPVAGGRAEIKLKRLQIAERLCRITGQGIYRDSTLVGESVPLRPPALNGQVMGQDTVIATPYRGKLYWFWGDTDRASYPLGNFGASGATSEWPGRGGLDPGQGVALTYFTGTEGFSKPMCPDAEFGEGLKWIEGVMTLRDEAGRERLLARVAAGTGLSRTRDWHLAQFHDEKQAFESIARWDIHDTHDSAHPFRARVGTNDYFYLYPNWRVRAELSALRELKSYEAFTCVADGGKLRGADTAIERDGTGRPRYAWKAGADRLHSGRLRELMAAGRLKRGESWLQLHDVETGRAVEAGRGSVFWNEFSQRWAMIVSGKAGEIWFSLADTPTGPWVYASRVATHGRYNFYNPTQHPFFDQERGRVLYFEGTYTASFSDAPAKTPRYDYNQLMYRLTLDDARLTLPVPVYRVTQSGGQPRYLSREGVVAERAWRRIQDVAFFALPPAHRGSNLIPVYVGSDGVRWQTNTPAPTSRPLFLAWPASDETTPGTELLRSETGTPLARVWRNPMTALALDPDPQAESPARP